MSNQNEYTPIEYVVVEKKARLSWRRVGCFLLLPVWFLILLIPFLMFVLAIQEDITLEHRSDIPNKYAHPWFQVKLIMDLDYRGVSITRSTLHEEEDSLCIQMYVSYMLWEGEGTPATFCECYNAQEDGWGYLGAYEGPCQGLEGLPE